jgi:hypothetical protein
VPPKRPTRHTLTFGMASRISGLAGAARTLARREAQV